MAGQVAETVVGGVLVEFAERRIIENLFDEFVDGGAVVQDHQADVDEFGGVLVGDADAEKLLTDQNCRWRSQVPPHRSNPQSSDVRHGRLKEKKRAEVEVSLDFESLHSNPQEGRRQAAGFIVGRQVLNP